MVDFVVSNFLEVQDFSVWDGKSLVLSKVSLALEDKKLLAVIGPHGAGKSTLLRCMNRLLDDPFRYTFQGKILLNGKDIYDAKRDVLKLRRKMCMIFQEPNLFPHMSLFENLTLGLRLSGVISRSQMQESVEEALQKVGLLEELGDRLLDLPNKLSVGDQQKVAVARALALKPKALLLDEPTSLMNLQETQEFESLLHNLRGTIAMIFTTRRRKQAARFSDRTAFLLDGELVETGKTSDLFMNPQDTRTEDYLTGRFG